MNISQAVFRDACNFLASERNKEKAARRLAQKGLNEAEAAYVVDEAHRFIKAGIRKQALFKMAGGAALLLIFGAVFLFTGYLFYIILPLAAISFLYGLGQMVFATGYTPLE